MAKTLTITEARSQLLDLAEQLNRPPATEAVTVGAAAATSPPPSRAARNKRHACKVMSRGR